MNKIRITKIFSFEMAHALDFHDGKCKNIHGHSYNLEVTLIGTPNNENVSSKGMVLDFATMKEVVNEEVINKLDHALMLHRNSGYVKLAEDQPKLVLVDYQPTCENMVIDFAVKISKSLPAEVNLCKLKLTETATSFAEWYASDNQ